MKTLKQFPPNYNQIVAIFPEVKKMKNVVFSYGDTVYCPYHKNAISDYLKVHESTHSKQQGSDPKKWWDRYLIDAPFRTSQELEAYQRQYRFYCEKNHNLKQRLDFLMTIASDLSGPMYNLNISIHDAMVLIERKK